MSALTEKEILEVAAKYCEFSCEGTYHLNKYSGWAIVSVVRECLELQSLVTSAMTTANAQPEQKALP